MEIRTGAAVREARKTPGRMVLNAGRGGGYRGRIGVELRGQSSLRFPKKSYALETRTVGGKNRNVGLLGMPPDDDWILYAAYNDKTLVRNVVAYDLSRRLGRYAARTRFVHLTVNGDYRGVYVLMEQLKLHDDRIDVDRRGVTGGYLLEWTFPYQGRRKGASFRTAVTRRPIVFEDPERSELTRRERRYARRLLDRIELALWGRSGSWRDHVDAEAAVDYVLLQELFKNVDAFHASTYFTKPAHGKLQLGPVWDFDLSSGNSTSPGSATARGWWLRDRGWAKRLYRDAAFRRAMAGRWRELRSGGFRREVLRSVARAARAVRPGVGRNFRRWPVLGTRVWPNPVARGSWGAEVRFLRRWLERRMRWMDRAMRRLGRRAP